MTQWVVGLTALGGVVQIALAVLAVRNRDVGAAGAYALVSLVAGTWALLQVAVVGRPAGVDPVVVYRLAKVVANQLPVVWLVFAVVYAGHREWLTPPRVLALWVPPTALAVARYLLPVGGPFAQPLSLATVGGVTAPVPAPTGADAVATVVAYGYVLAAFAVLVSFLLDPANVYRKQTGAVLASGLVPFLGDVLFATGSAVHPGLSLAPALLVVHSSVIAAALFRYDGYTITASAGDVLVEEIPDPVVVLDDEDRVVTHNRAASDLATDADLTGTHAEDLLPGLTERTDGTLTARLPGEEEPPTVFEVESGAVTDQFGECRGRVVLLRDVSADQRRLDQLEAMQAATRRLIAARTEAEVGSVAVEFASDALGLDYAVVFVHDAETDALESVAESEAAAAALGEDLTVTPPDGDVWSAFVDGETARFDGDGELRVGPESLPVTAAVVFPLGERGAVLVGSDDERDYAGVERHLAGILARTVETALTRVDRERELRESRAALERRTRQIEFFNGVLRHNIRNGMTVVHGQAAALEDRVDDTDRVEMIQRWCDDLTELTETVRDVNATVAASEAERLEPVDLRVVVADRLDALRQEHDGVETRVDVDTDLTVAANHLAADVVDALVTNAVEHNDRDRPRVEVTSWTVGEWVQLRIADDGPGLSDDLKNQVFQRELGASHTAHGFGLYFVSVMMDLYGGNVWFDDNDPRGTVVVLEFRRHEALDRAAVTE